MATKFVLRKILSEKSAAAGEEDFRTLGEYAFNGSMFTVGSDEANNLVLDEAAAEQAVIVHEGDHLTLINSAAGTRLNGQNLRREAIQVLSGGDEIRIGNYVISVLDDEAALPTIENEKRKTFQVAENANGFEENGFSPPPEAVKQTDHPPASVAAATTIVAAKTTSEVKSSSNFAAVLDTLRTEEDSFYFIVKNGERETGRVPLESAEMPIGANGKGEIVFDIEQISVLFGIARKDWSGILLESQRRNSIFVNDQPLDAPQRLRNDDRVSFSSAAPAGFSLVLHEPSLLVALEPLLSARKSSGVARFGDSDAAAGSLAGSAAAKQKASLLERRFFNHFSFVEIVTMIIGTLIGAVLFFLFFEFMFA